MPLIRATAVPTSDAGSSVALARRHAYSGRARRANAALTQWSQRDRRCRSRSGAIPSDRRCRVAIGRVDRARCSGAIVRVGGGQSRDRWSRSRRSLVGGRCDRSAAARCGASAGDDRDARLAAAIDAAAVRRGTARRRAALRIDGPAAHYLAQVMRTKPGDPVKLFDDATGEWLAVVDDVGEARPDARRDASGCAPREPVPDLWLVRRAAQEGADRLDGGEGVRAGRRAAVCRCSPAARWSTGSTLDRLRAHMIEAAEQCGRTALPESPSR